MGAPTLVRDGSVVVKIYRQRAPSAKAGYTNVVTWIGPEGRQKHSETDDREALRWARQKAAELSAGIAVGASRADLVELAEARRMAGEAGLLAALTEWAHLRQRAAPVADTVGYDEAVRRFLAAKASLGRSVSTYDYKLRELGKHLPKKFLGDITTAEWAKALAPGAPATRNDRRKRAVTLCRWAQRHALLPANVRPAVEATERAKEPPLEIGILSPGEMEALLRWTRAHHPRQLAYIVLGGFCGLRVAELQGRRGGPGGQRWADVRDREKFLVVSLAKENTPASRVVHLMPAARAWLRACGPRSQFVGEGVSMDWLRRLALKAGLRWPPNGLRHSYISHLVALTGDKAGAATQAGTSVKQIDRHYRRPLPRAQGRAWWALRP